MTSQSSTAIPVWPAVRDRITGLFAGSASRKQSLTCLLIAACAVVSLAHLPGLSARAVYLDDHAYVLENDRVQAPSWASVRRFFTEIWAPSTVRGYYQPLTMISLMVDRHMSGRYDSITAYHRTSLALHLANTILLAVFLYLLFDQPLVAAGVALLFGLHPLTVESVCWIAERKTVLATFFALWSLIAYTRYTRDRKRRYYVACTVAYVLALLSKPIVVPLPATLLLMDYWPFDRLHRKSVSEKLPLFAIGAIFAVITYVSQSRTTPVYLPGDYDPWHVPLILCHNIVFYLYKLLWPAGLSAHYGFPEAMSLSNPTMLLGIAGTSALISLLVISRRRTRAPLVGWLIFFVMIFPAMGVVSVTPVIAANRYLYLPSIGLLVLLAALLTWASGAHARPQAAIRQLAIVIVLLLAAGAETIAMRHYQAQWQDTMGLHRYLLAKEPNAAVLNTNMASELARVGRSDEAIEHYHRALEASPDDKVARINLASLLHGLGGSHRDDAIHHYQKALEVDPSHFVARLNLGSVVLSQGDVTSAVAHYREAVGIDPENPLGHYNLGKALAFDGLPDEALKQLREALRLNPRYVLAMKDLAWFLATHPYEEVRDPNEALRLAQQANAVTGGRDIAVLDTLAAAYACDERYSKAVEIGEKAYEMTVRTGNDELAGQIEEHLRAYDMEFPYIEAPRVQLDRLIAKEKEKERQAASAPSVPGLPPEPSTMEASQ